MQCPKKSGIPYSTFEGHLQKDIDKLMFFFQICIPYSTFERSFFTFAIPYSTFEGSIFRICIPYSTFDTSIFHLLLRKIPI